MDKLRIACAQLIPHKGPPSANVERHLHFIRQAVSDRCHVLVFPELSLTGYGNWDNVIDYSRMQDCEELTELSRMAPEMHIFVSFIEEEIGGLFYNSTALLYQGKVKAIHRKINLPSYGRLIEDKAFSHGKEVKAVDLIGPWKATSLICADLWDPTLVNIAAFQRSTLLIAPIASCIDAVSKDFSNEYGWDLTTKFYSMIYGLPIALCNWAKNADDESYWGGSRILDSRGHIIAKAGNQEEMIVAELNYPDLKKARFELPTLRDMNMDITLNMIQKLKL